MWCNIIYITSLIWYFALSQNWGFQKTCNFNGWWLTIKLSLGIPFSDLIKLSKAGLSWFVPTTYWLWGLAEHTHMYSIYIHIYLIDLVYQICFPETLAMWNITDSLSVALLLLGPRTIDMAILRFVGAVAAPGLSGARGLEGQLLKS